MSLILPKHVAAKLKTQRARQGAGPEGPNPYAGGAPSGEKHALFTDDFIDPGDVAEQVATFLAYDGVVPRPVGWRVSVLVLTIPEVTSGGLIMASDDREARSLASPQGIILALGPTAYADPARFPDKKPWVNVGDRVMFQKYGGRMFQIRTGQHIAILNDTEFAGVVDGGWLEQGDVQ